MGDVEIVVSGDAAETLARASGYLQGDPVANHLVLSLLEDRAARPEPGRFWTAAEAGTVIGVAFQSPLTLHAAITPMAPAAVQALVERMGAEVPDLPGVFGPADTTSRFAGSWAEVRSVPAHPVEGQRLYQLEDLVLPSAGAGRRRIAEEADEDMVWSWLRGFGRETGGIMPDRDSLGHRIGDGSLSLWDTGEPVSMASFTAPVAGVSRIYLVYTPPAQRRRGYAAACTAAVSQAALEAGAERCVLFTQLGNPQSNAIYRRIGYRPVMEQIRYSFGP